MTEQTEKTKTELMKEIESAWKRLQAALDRLTEAQLASEKDLVGWAVKDHVLHIAAWECSVVFLLQGRPRHAGLGISEDLYLSGSVDEINTAVFERYAEVPPDEALARLRDVHILMLAVLRPLSDADLRKPYRDYLPDEAGEGDGPPVINIVYGNTAGHYAEHLVWIEALVSGQRNGLG